MDANWGLLACIKASKGITFLIIRAVFCQVHYLNHSTHTHRHKHILGTWSLFYFSLTWNGFCSFVKLMQPDRQIIKCPWKIKKSFCLQRICITVFGYIFGQRSVLLPLCLLWLQNASVNPEHLVKCPEWGIEILSMGCCL